MSIISTPPLLRGGQSEQLAAIRSYLYQLAEQLNQSMNSLTVENFAPGAAQALQQAGGGDTDAVRRTVDESAAALKALIIKTANVVQSHVDVLELLLRSDYLAISDFGTFREQIESRLQATAESITATYDYAAQIQASLQQGLEDLESSSQAADDALRAYLVETTGYIKQGIIGYNGAVPIIGIAIGQDIRTTGTETVDGQEYEIINTSSNMTTWTTEKMSFYVNGVETAYFSNGALHVNKIELGERLTAAGKWDISFAAGVAIKWIGG